MHTNSVRCRLLADLMHTNSVFAVQNTCRPDAYQFCAVQTIRRLYAHIAQNKSVSIKMSQHARRGPVGPFFEAKVAMLWPPRRGGVFRGRSGCGRRTLGGRSGCGRRSPGGRRRSVPGRRIRARRPRGRTVGCGRRTPGGRGRSAGGQRAVGGRPPPPGRFRRPLHPGDQVQRAGLGGSLAADRGLCCRLGDLQQPDGLKVVHVLLVLLLGEHKK